MIRNSEAFIHGVTESYLIEIETGNLSEGLADSLFIARYRRVDSGRRGGTGEHGRYDFAGEVLHK